MAHHRLTPPPWAVRARAAAALLLGTIALLTTLAFAPPVADAAPQAPSQTSCEDDGYGCPTSSTQSTINANCSLSATSGLSGGKITATITNIPVGTTVRLLFDGSVVATETATSDGEGAPGADSVAADGTTGGAVITFTVPNDPGPDHTVVFSGAGFSCDATGGAGFEVLSQTASRGGDSLSTTGMNVAIFLAVALVLIVVGAQLVRASRKRKRRAARHTHRRLYPTRR